jgi:phage shock protein PspC (stress-responsive transcriptional regulator)
MRKIYHLKDFIEWQAFGVCSSLGEHLGISTSRIRLWFIYVSFLTLGSPVVVYMTLAFVRNLKHYFWISRRNPLKWL